MIWARACLSGRRFVQVGFDHALVPVNFSSRYWSTDAEVALKRAERAHKFHTGRREIYFANALLTAIERAR
jgi:hypothetical protein